MKLDNDEICNEFLDTTVEFPPKSLLIVSIVFGIGVTFIVFSWHFLSSFTSGADSQCGCYQYV